MALTNVFRTDGWVKTVQGPAVPGAQIYVCLQPANSTSLPPTPLANIFSDVNGLVPLAQPIITDGFGHYDFYAAAGVYTIIVANGGIIQQVYPDQSVGGFSGTGGGGGGTALVLQVAGTLNVKQTLLNLQGAGSTTVVDQGNGTVQISSTGSTFSTSNQGWFAGPGMTDASSILMNSADSHLVNFFGGIGANTVLAWQFTLQSTWVLSKVSFQLSGTGAGGSSFNFGIYNSTGNKLIDSGAFNGAITSAQTLSFSTTTLSPGTYYFAYSMTDTNIHGPVAQVGSAITAIIGMMTNPTNLWATAANGTVSGTMPATLGTLSPLSVNTDALPLPIWKV